MKKLVCGIVGIMAAVSAASANDVAQDTAKLKAACQASDKLVWVERNQVCIPKNPCKDSKYESYCNRDFARVQTQNLTTARYLAKGFLEIKGFSTVECLSNQTGRETSAFGQNYIACTTKVGDYVVFEFDDTTNDEITSKATFEEEAKAAGILCEAVGGKLSNEPFSFYCMGIEKDACDAWNVALFRAYTSDNVEAYTLIADYYYDSQTKACKQGWTQSRRE